ncbi:MAG TPA: sigma-70 family RNA polymerase sigma factor [Puia sp.]|nr:sigma-70 family RNA polymerase sigma factor [Puia sp.]
MLNDAGHSEVWARLLQGDPEALVTLYNSYYLGLVNYGLKMTRDRELTNDCITQVLLRLWDKRASLPLVRNPQSYLLSCLRNELYTELKSANTRLARTRAIQRTIGDAEPSYEEFLIEGQTNKVLRDHLEKAFKKLTVREKELLRLKFFEDLDYAEIAMRCHITKRTAYNIIHTALKTLKAGLVINPDNDWVRDATFLSLVFLLLSQMG